MRSKILILNGPARVGKDAIVLKVGELAADKNIAVRNISSVGEPRGTVGDGVEAAARKLGLLQSIDSNPEEERRAQDFLSIIEKIKNYYAAGELVAHLEEINSRIVELHKTKPEFTPELVARYGNMRLEGVKSAAMSLGWDGTEQAKTPEARAAMVHLKQVGIAYNELPLLFMLQELRTVPEEDAIVFIHMRERPEIDKCLSVFNAEFPRTDILTMLVTREGVERIPNPADDQDFDPADYDIYFPNDTQGLDLLKDQVERELWPKLSETTPSIPLA